MTDNPDPIEPRRQIQFTLRGLLVFMLSAALFWALLRILNSPYCPASIGLSLPGLAALGFCLVSVRSRNVGLSSKISLAIASGFLSLALLLSLCEKLVPLCPVN